MGDHVAAHILARGSCAGGVAGVFDGAQYIGEGDAAAKYKMSLALVQQCC